MRLSEVNTVLGLGSYVDTVDPDVVDLTQDSRAVQSDWIFACVTGGSSDGHDFAEAAVASGATGLLVERPTRAGVPELIVPDTRVAMATVSAALHGRPSERLRVIGVTGTSGKTTVTTLVGQLLNLLGEPTKVLGTLSGARTTPESPILQRQMGTWVDEGVKAVAMEVSSHALTQHRVDAVDFSVAVFLNLSPEHLDYHENMEQYFAAKRSLFEDHGAPHQLVCADGPWGARLADELGETAVRFDLQQITNTTRTASGSNFVWRGQSTGISMPGQFNISNVQAAAEIAVLLGYTPEQIAPLLRELSPVPGRLQPVDEGQAFDVIVDYAHKPAALEVILHEARTMSDGRVHIVMGCGGNRDTKKRPEMGRIAAEAADVTYLTSDNPRNESPDAIISEIIAGVPTGRLDTVRIIADRAEAIREAIHNAVDGDIVVIAGKGHETTQTFSDYVVDFDDREVASAILREQLEDTL